MVSGPIKIIEILEHLILIPFCKIYEYFQNKNSIYLQYSRFWCFSTVYPKEDAFGLSLIKSTVKGIIIMQTATNNFI